QARARTHRIYPSVETVAAFAYLPLHRTGWATHKSNRHRTVVLCAAIGLRRTRRSKVAADISGVELNRVHTGICVKPGRSRCVECGNAGVERPVNTAIVSYE